MTCEDCYKLTTTDKDGQGPYYCTKKGTVLSEEFCLKEHPNCCVCDGRKDGYDY